MARYQKRIRLAEERCRNEFRNYLGNKYDKIFYPKSEIESFDLLCLTSSGEQHLFELKLSDRYYLDSFREEGAMIDVKKWNSLITLTQDNKYVFYMRMYIDGFAVWHMNSLTLDDWKEGNYIRKYVTVSNSNNTRTKSKCVLINFNSALHIHQKPSLFKRAF